LTQAWINIDPKIVERPGFSVAFRVETASFQTISSTKLGSDVLPNRSVVVFNNYETLAETRGVSGGDFLRRRSYL
jgi:hypothetical protein